jgi:predicted nucleotidyltransferase
MSRDEAIQILNEVYAECAGVLPCGITDAWLYGSYARGDYHEDSDVDILLTVDLEWPEITACRKNISRVVSDLCLKHDVTVSVTIKPLRHFRQYAEDLPFYRNVVREGIPYVA